MSRAMVGVAVTLGALFLPSALLAQTASLEVASASGRGGETVTVQARLFFSDTDVSSVGVQVGFDTPLSVPEIQPRRPNCTVDLATGAVGRVFTYVPFGCSVGGTCTGVDLGIPEFEFPNPLSSGQVLFSCEVTIASNAAEGDYPFTCDAATVTPPINEPPVQTQCVDGVIHVIGPAPTPTATPVPATPTAVPSNGGGGCALQPGSSASTWLLLAAAVLRLVRRPRPAL